MAQSVEKGDILEVTGLNAERIAVDMRGYPAGLGDDGLATVYTIDASIDVHPWEEAKEPAWSGFRVLGRGNGGCCEVAGFLAGKAAVWFDQVCRHD
jgi:hypothetical protein